MKGFGAFCASEGVVRALAGVCRSSTLILAGIRAIRWYHSLGFGP